MVARREGIPAAILRAAILRAEMNSVAVAILISMTDVARPILPALLRADPRTGLVVLSAANRAQPVGEAAGRVVSVVPATALLDVR
jgi:hypothetical protein